MNKVGIVGLGMVGSSFAYTLVNQNMVDELVLVDRKVEYSNAQANDILDGTIFLDRQPKIHAGNYSDLENAELICITSGANQKPGETRLDLLKKNSEIMTSIIKEIKKFDFKGVLLIAANPVDILTYVAQEVSGYETNRVIGSGTVLDSARFSNNLSKYLGYSATQINANIIGEHGDNSIPIWSTARVGNKLILDILLSNPEKYTKEGLNKCYDDARNSAYKIIEAKGSTHYGIALALAEITKSVLHDENKILNVSQRLNGEYRQNDVCLSVPGIVGKNGVKEIFENSITEQEYERLSKTTSIIKEHQKKIFE